MQLTVLLITYQRHNPLGCGCCATVRQRGDADGHADGAIDADGAMLMAAGIILA